MNDLIRDKLKVNLEDIIKTDDLSYRAISKKNYNFNKMLCLLFFLEIYIKDI